jgi:hypothetical protein
MNIKKNIISTMFFAIIFCVASLYAMQVHYHSAGVVPYAVDSANQVWVLVGTEPARHHQAFDFGGKKDPVDKDDPLYTAAREGAEELLFLYDETDQEFIHLVELALRYGKNINLNRANSITYLQFLHNMNNNHKSLSNGYMTYFVKIPYQADIPTRFETRYKNFKDAVLPGNKRVPYNWFEKSQLYWVKLTDLINALTTQNIHNITLTAENSKGKRQIYLFPAFARSLYDALRRGILAQIK